jgi:hypothetical protein
MGPRHRSALACWFLKYKIIEITGRPKGTPKTGGRKAGTPNKRTVALQSATATAAEQINAVLGSDAFEGDALAFLMLVYRDPRQPVGLRLEAAKAALPYQRPRIASIAGKGENDDLKEMSREELKVVIYGRTLVEIEAERRANAPKQLPGPGR